MRQGKAASLQGCKAARPVRPAILLLIATGLLVLTGPRSQARGLADSQAPVAPPHRIISLIPSVTEMLFAIGAGDAVIGVSSFDHYPHEVESRVKVGGLIDPDFERILSLRPDLVVVYGTQSGLIDRLARAHVPMYHYEHAGLADITQTLRQIGVHVGRADAANRLAADIERRLSDIRTKSSSRPKPKTMIVFGREPGSLRGMLASGGIGFLHDMLDTAGGTDVFADMRRQSLQVTSELALARAPEVKFAPGRPGPPRKLHGNATPGGCWPPCPPSAPGAST
jgi:iron complex transport system substrate-binding protein